MLRIGGASDGAVFFEHISSGETVVFEGIDGLVLSYGGTPLTDLEDALATWPGDLRVVGDCVSPRTAEEAVFDGFRAALEI